MVSCVLCHADSDALFGEGTPKPKSVHTAFTNYGRVGADVEGSLAEIRVL